MQRAAGDIGELLDARGERLGGGGGLGGGQVRGDFDAQTHELLRVAAQVRLELQGVWVVKCKSVRGGTIISSISGNTNERKHNIYLGLHVLVELEGLGHCGAAVGGGGGVPAARGEKGDLLTVQRVQIPEERINVAKKIK